MTSITTPLLASPAIPPGEDVAIESSRRAELARLVFLYVVSVGIALGVAVGLVAAVGGSPGSVVSAIFQGSLDGWASISATINATTPVLIVALGTVIAVRAGMFNIGQAGQLTMGATLGAAIALKVPGPGPLVLVLSLLGAAAGGAIWAGIAAVLRFKWKISAVISTLLLIYIANEVLAYLVSSPNFLQEPNPVSGEGGALPQSDLLRAGVRLPNFSHGGIFINSGVVIALVLLVTFTVLLQRSHWGLKVRMVGQNVLTARRFGVRVGLVAGGALVLCGAFAGLAGGVMLTGAQYRVQAGFENGFATDGLLAALVVRDNPIALVFVSFFFGVIRVGGNFLLSAGVPSYLYQVLEGLLVLAAVFPPVYLERREWARRLANARAILREAR